MLDSARIFAVDGPDGSGKTYWVEHNIKDRVYVHMIPFSRRWSVRKTFIGGIFVEIIMGWERRHNSNKAKRLSLTNKIIMDRCFIAAEAYASFWDKRFNTTKYTSICRWWNKRMFKPKDILLFVPSPGQAKPRKKYSNDDIESLNHEYYLALKRYGYRFVEEEEYNFGVIQLWCR